MEVQVDSPLETSLECNQDHMSLTSLQLLTVSQIQGSSLRTYKILNSHQPSFKVHGFWIHYLITITQIFTTFDANPSVEISGKIDGVWSSTT